MKYQIMPENTTPLQKRLEDRAKIAPKIQRWKRELGEHLTLLREEYRNGASEQETYGRRIVVEALISSIKDIGSGECPEEIKYQNLVKYKGRY